MLRVRSVLVTCSVDWLRRLSTTVSRILEPSLRSWELGVDNNRGGPVQNRIGEFQNMEWTRTKLIEYIDTIDAEMKRYSEEVIYHFKLTCACRFDRPLVPSRPCWPRRPFETIDSPFSLVFRRSQQQSQHLPSVLCYRPSPPP